MLVACATAPFDTTGVDKTLTPDSALARTDSARGQKILWGGIVIHSRNHKDTTEVEVLGYPLDGSGRPNRGAAPQHRFLIVHDGYLETADYRAGRSVSALGTFSGTRRGSVGEAPYDYPVMHAQQVHLWPIDAGRNTYGPHFGVGIGIILSR